jgi:hypothetical protein
MQYFIIAESYKKYRWHLAAAIIFFTVFPFFYYLTYNFIQASKYDINISQLSTYKKEASVEGVLFEVYMQDMQKLKSQGFTDYKTFKTAESLGFTDYKTFKTAESLGFTDYKTFKTAESLGALNYEEFEAASKLGRTESHQWEADKAAIREKGISLQRYVNETIEIRNYINQCYAVTRLAEIVGRGISSKGSANVTRSFRAIEYMAKNMLIYQGIPRNSIKLNLDALFEEYAPAKLLHGSDVKLYDEKSQNLLREHKIKSDICAELVTTNTIMIAILEAIPLADAEYTKEIDNSERREWITRCKRHDVARAECAIAAQFSKCLEIKIGYADASLGNTYCKGPTPNWWLMGRKETPAN